jgi:hypothetical protein
MQASNDQADVAVVGGVLPFKISPLYPVPESEEQSIQVSVASLGMMLAPPRVIVPE